MSGSRNMSLRAIPRKHLLSWSASTPLPQGPVPTRPSAQHPPASPGDQTFRHPPTGKVINTPLRCTGFHTSTRRPYPQGWATSASRRPQSRRGAVKFPEHGAEAILADYPAKAPTALTQDDYIRGKEGARRYPPSPGPLSL